MGFDVAKWDEMRASLERFFEIKQTLKLGRIMIHGIEFKIPREVEKRLRERLEQIKAELKEDFIKLLEAE